MRKPGIWGLGFRRQGIIRVADVIDDAGTTTGIVVHVAGNNTLFNQENFDDQVTRSSAPVLLDFWAAWCGPCSMLSPVVEELAEEHPEISFGKVNVDEAPELAQRYQISAIPTLLLFRDGEPVDVSVGVKSKAELEAFLK